MPSSLIIEADAAPPFMKNGFILSCAASGAAAYIDPGDEAPRLLEWIRARPLRIVSILLTHAHMDHISGVGEVKLHYDVPIHLHPADGFLYDGLQEQSRASASTTRQPLPSPTPWRKVSRCGWGI